MVLHTGDMEIQLFDSVETPIVVGLGLGAPGTTRFRPLVGFGMTCDMAFTHVTRTVIP